MCIMCYMFMFELYCVMCMRSCMHACVYACMHACVHACVSLYVSQHHVKIQTYIAQNKCV